MQQVRAYILVYLKTNFSPKMRESFVEAGMYSTLDKATVSVKEALCVYGHPVSQSATLPTKSIDVTPKEKPKVTQTDQPDDEQGGSKTDVKVGSKRKEHPTESSKGKKTQKVEDLKLEISESEWLKKLVTLTKFDCHNWSYETEFGLEGEWNLEFRLKKIRSSDEKYYDVKLDEPISEKIMNPIREKWIEKKKQKK